MRPTPPEFNDEVAGTTSGDRLEVHAWRGSELLAENLDLVSWNLDWNADRAVQGQATFTIADPEGRLAPWGYGDALAPGGSRLYVTWVSGTSGTRVPLGRWRIRSAEPREQWRLYTHTGRVDYVPGGGRITVRADEETATIALARLEAGSKPSDDSVTVIDEVRRLLSGLCTVTVDPELDDVDVPRTLVYGESRLDAVTDLLARMGAVYRMGPAGELEVIPEAGVGPVWAAAGGEDDGVLVGVQRSLTDEGVYNAAISVGETAAGAPLVGRAYIDGGPLAYGGPYNQVPIFHQAPDSVTTLAGVEQDAVTLLANRQLSGEADLSVTCLTHPALQVHDLVTVLAPTTAGEEPVTGRVVGMTMTSAGTTPAKVMTLRVRVSVQALEAIASRVRRG